MGGLVSKRNMVVVAVCRERLTALHPYPEVYARILNGERGLGLASVGVERRLKKREGPVPVRPRALDARALEERIRVEILDPYYGAMRDRLRQAEDARDALLGIEGVEAPLMKGVPVVVRRYLRKVSAYHRRRLIESFRAALSLDIRPLLGDDVEIWSLMRARLAHVVSLIRTIPPGLKADLLRRVEKEFRAKPFDKRRMARMVGERFGVHGYRLRRIVRDQTNKVVGELTRVRHVAIGIDSYRWSTSGDERVRASHRSNGGKVFRWDSPPAETGHPGDDVQCRCVAVPVVPGGWREEVRGR